MNQVILQLFSRLNVLFLSDGNIVYSSAWDYNQETLNAVCSVLLPHQAHEMRVIIKTTVVTVMKENYQLLEELVIDGKKHYCVMDKHDYTSIVSLAKECKIPELLLYSSLDYYRFLTKETYLFLDEFSDREVAAYVFEKDNLIGFDYSTTQSADSLITSMLKKYPVTHIWNMARYSIPVPEMERVINFAELSEEARTQLSPSFASMGMKPSRVVDIHSTLSTISQHSTSTIVEPRKVDVESAEKPPETLEKTRKRSLFGSGKKTAETVVETPAVAVAEPPPSGGLFDFNDLPPSPEEVNDMWSLPNDITQSPAPSGLFDFDSLGLDTQTLQQTAAASSSSLFSFPEAQNISFGEPLDSPEIKSDSYDEVVHGKRNIKDAEIGLADVLPTNKSDKPRHDWVERNKSVSDGSRKLIKIIAVLVILCLLFVLYNMADEKGYTTAVKDWVVNLYQSKVNGQSSIPNPPTQTSNNATILLGN